ncbi:hypothetical protein NA57DRAFT_81796 [Rhizodiscina lignyota]|uniref:RRM domain-containing protein n=1 Tax=Rhizodiscina lignyota TaxID=1504668 RepID=A0A9P4M3C0_9PEZI|nr:hypothetical protein NA57DRAFT_81796 [Rhizodiscina lignyota]
MVPPSHAAGGVLPMPTAVLQKHSNSSNTSPGKASAPRLKLVLRRLPPGLTQAEFEAALGDEWKVGQGKVDWREYKSGKVSRDLAKPSRPSRAYIHLTSQTHLQALSEKVRTTTFNDAKNTMKDAALIGPPSLEFAPYTRIPSGKRRNDARQGLIDQDSEFQAFLESLTNPAPKPTAAEVDEHLREKKAAKEKAAKEKGSSGGKGGKHARQESKEDKSSEKGEGKKASAKAARDATASPEKGKKLSKADRAAKEAVKVLNKEAAASSTSASTPATENTPTATPPKPAAERKRERGNASIAAKMLQRDLGIGPGAGGRRGKRELAGDSAKHTEPSTAPKDAAPATPPTAPAAAAASTSDTRSPKKDNKPTRAERRAHKAALAEKNSDQSPSAAAPAPTILKKAPTGPAAQQHPPQRPPTGPAAARASPTPSAVSATSAASVTATPSPSQSTSSPPSSGRQAFLKHANPSQGITEVLLQTALSTFGNVENVEIDKRKGFAYATFESPEGLEAAIKASPVKVAEGAVVILEKREGGTGGRGQPQAPRGGGGHFGRGRGGGRGGRGGMARGGAASAGGSPATPPAAPATPATPANEGAAI